MTAVGAAVPSQADTRNQSVEWTAKDEFSTPAVEPLTVLVDVEECLVGALTHQSTTQAAAWLRLIDETDMSDPRASLAVNLIRRAVVQRIDPDPAALIAFAQSSGEIGTGDRLTRFSSFVLNCYTGVPLPSNGLVYLIAVLEAALRRTTSQVGDRIKQAAGELGRADLMPVVTDQFRAIAAVRDRLIAAEKARNV